MKKITKTIIMLVSVFFVLLLASCSKSVLNEDPIKIARDMDEKSYDSQILVDSKDIEDFADEFNIREMDIEWIVAIEAEDWQDYDKVGVLIYTSDRKSAKEMHQDLEEYMDENKDDMEEVKRPIVERSGKYVFIGSEIVWDLLNGIN